MAKYFSKYPKILHSFDGNNGTLVTFLLARVQILESVLTNSLLYYEYTIQDGDTPEIIADKYYNDPERHWIILMANKIIDPFYDWPMTTNQFNDFIKSKYGSIPTAMTGVHHYEKIVDTTDSGTLMTTRKVYIVDLATYNSMQFEPETTVKVFDNGGSVTEVVSKRIVSNYDYENELNETKRTIKLLKKDYVSQVETELTRLLAA